MHEKTVATVLKCERLLCSPEGRKFRSKTELEAYIREYSLNVNISDFCFTVRGQQMLDLAASQDCNGRLYKRKRSASQETPIDGRLGNTSSCEVEDSLPRRKRMKLWERPNAKLTKAAVLPVNSDAHVDGSSEKESKKQEKKTKLLNSRLQPVKETSVDKDKDLLARHVVKLPNTKPRRASQKLTVRMKFMPTLSRKLKADSVRNQSSSQSQISDGFCSAANSTNILMPNGKASAAGSVCKVVCKQTGPHNEKQQSKHFNLIRQQVSPVTSPASNRKRDLVLPRQSIVNDDELSMDIQWIPPQSPFNLVEESLFHSSWKILVASIILENGQGWLASNVCQVPV